MSTPQQDRLLHDKFAIAQRIAIYNHTLDQGRYDAFLKCWCDDGVFEGAGVGKDGILVYLQTHFARFRSPLHGLKHFTVNIVSHVSGDLATSSSHLQAVCTESRGARIVLTGRYEDELRRVDGAWLFARRKLYKDMPLKAVAAQN